MEYLVVKKDDDGNYIWVIHESEMSYFKTDRDVIFVFKIDGDIYLRDEWIKIS